MEDLEFLQSTGDRRKVDLRHEAEAIYYADVDIPTYQVTSDDFNQNVMKNLRLAYPWYSRSPETLKKYINSAELLINASYGNGDSPFDLGVYFCRKRGITFEEWKHILYTILWTRTIRFDLTSPFLIDFPVKIAPIDTADRFDNLLSRGPA